MELTQFLAQALHLEAGEAVARYHLLVAREDQEDLAVVVVPVLVYLEDGRVELQRRQTLVAQPGTAIAEPIAQTQGVAQAAEALGLLA